MLPSAALLGFLWKNVPIFLVREEPGPLEVLAGGKESLPMAGPVDPSDFSDLDSVMSLSSDAAFFSALVF